MIENTNIEAVAQFVRERLDEDEKATLHAGFASWTYEPDRDRRPGGRVVSGPYVEIANDWHGSGYSPVSEHIARHDPAHTLADIKAKRAIVDVCLRLDDLPIGGGLWFQVSDHAEEILGHLASLWSEHPDYNPKWTEW